MYHPTTRVLAVLELLQTHGRLSGADMAARLGVDGRTLRRYIVTLEDIGIPILTERGRHGGYALMPGFKLPPMMFSDEEALALSVGLLAARSLGFSETAPAVESARAKLERIMPERLRQRVRAVDQTVRLDLLRTSAPADREALTLLSSAALAQQRIHLHYRAPDGRDSAREFDPYGLVLWEGCWYALGLCHLRQAMRSFRLDRIIRTEPRASQFVRPPGFDALAYLRAAFRSMPRAHQVQVVLHTDLENASAAWRDTAALFEPDAGGVLLRTETDHTDWFAARLCQMPCEFTVLGPPALQASVARLGQRLLRAGGAAAGA